MRFWIALGVLCLLVGCGRRRAGGGGDDDDGAPDGDADSDVDSDSDADSDTDTDTDTDADTDTDTDTDSDSDVDVDADTDSDADLDGDADVDGDDPCGWGDIPLSYEGPVEGSYVLGAGGTETPVTGDITLDLLESASDYDADVTITATDAGGFAFIGTGTGTLQCNGQVSGTFSGDGGGIPIDGTFSGTYDDPDLQFQDGDWDMADGLGFGVTGGGIWEADAI
jgi:hypothetical protein